MGNIPDVLVKHYMLNINTKASHTGDCGRNEKAERAGNVGLVRQVGQVGRVGGVKM